jgi:hypothetical protein
MTAFLASEAVRFMTSTAFPCFGSRESEKGIG